MTKPKLRAILLEAVSSDAQAEADEESLPEQDRRLLEVAVRRGWEIIDVILVDGFSRVYYNYREFAEDALKAGKAAPMRMFDHWTKRDFDVFAVSSGDRFGREQSIFAEVVARTIDAGATVFTLRDGDIHEGNRRMFVSMAGYQAAVEIDELVRRRRSGMKKRARKGLPTSSGGLIPSHVVVPLDDENDQVIVNEAARRLFADVGDLLMAGVSWQQMPAKLAERGHASSPDCALSAANLRNWLMHPTLHGNTAQHFEDKTHSAGRGFWVFDPAVPAPEHVTIYYNTHPPIYEGQQAARIQAELRRRFGSNGKSRPQPRRKFSGLVVCDYCHYAMSYKAERYGRLIVRCESRNHPRSKSGCPNRLYVSEKKVVAYAEDMLHDLLDNDDWSALYSADATRADLEARQRAVDAELQDVSARIDLIIEKQIAAKGKLSTRYDVPLEKAAEQLEALEVEQQRLKLEAEAAAPTFDQLQSIEELRNSESDQFWEWPSLKINQWLHRIMGNGRFVAADGEITGITSFSRRAEMKRKRP